VILHRTVVPVALLALAAGACAQTSPADPNAPAPIAASTPAGIISIYGIADGGVEYTKPAGTESTTEVISGGKSGSRLGFRGTKEFDKGWNAQVVLEMGYTLDSGMLKQGGRTFGRQAFVALNGPAGTVAIGRIPSFSAGSGNFDYVGDIDAFLTQFGSAGAGQVLSSAAGLRLDNTVLYSSPVMNGLRVGIGHSFQNNGNESPGSGNNESVTITGLRYNNGGLSIGASYDVFHNPAGGPSEKHFQLLTAYDFETFKLFAAVGKEQDLFDGDDNSTATTDGATVPFAGGTIRASYQWRNQTDNRNLRVPSIGYEYYLLKNLQLYAAFDDVQGKDALKGDPDHDHRDLVAGIYFRF
jgi:predicted porin